MDTDVQTLNEPKIEDILEDPIVLAVLERDGLTVDDIRQVIATYHENVSNCTN